MKNLTFTGVDVDLETSLLEYGILVSNEVHEDGSGTHFVVYRYGLGFGTSHISEKEVNKLLNESWFDKMRFLSFVGMTETEFIGTPLVHKIFDMIQYYGPDNIVGTTYYPISEKEAIKLYL